jgi:hypothetical protein
MYRKLAVVVTCAFVVSHALGAVAEPKAEDTKTRLAIELMQAAHFDRNMQLMKEQIPAMMEKQFDSLAGCDAVQPVMKEFSGAVADKVSEILDSEDLKIDIAAVYAETFSEDELRGVIAFYESPLGKKLLDRMPELMQKSMQISQDRMKPIMSDMQKLGEQYASRIKEASKTCKASSAQPAGAK